MLASDIMSGPVFIISPKDTVAHARNLMIKHKISRCPVLENSKLKGIITKKDLAFGLRQTEPIWRRRPIDRIPVGILMGSPPLTVAPSTPVKEIARIMVKHDISGLPVNESDEIIGIVTKSDILGSELVSNLMITAADLLSPLETISRYHSLDHVINIMSEQNDKVIVVNNDGTLAGIITESNVAFFTYMNEKTELPERDVQFLRRQEPAGRKLFRDVMVVSAIAEDVMSRPVISVPSADAPIKEIVALMLKHHINSVIVADGKEIKGIVKRDEIIQEVAK
jgi:CBS domain-containing protein